MSPRNSAGGRLNSYVYLQKRKYPVTRQPIKIKKRSKEVVGIKRIMNIPIAIHIKANPIKRFIKKLLSLYIILLILYAQKQELILPSINSAWFFTLSCYKTHYASSRISATSSSVILSSFLVVKRSRISGAISRIFVIVS